MCSKFAPWRLLEADMTKGLLVPTVEDVDLVLSWLPSVGAEEFRGRLLLIRSRLLTGTRSTNREQHLNQLANVATSTGILATWLADLELELRSSDVTRTEQIQQLLMYLNQ